MKKRTYWLEFMAIGTHLGAVIVDVTPELEEAERALRPQYRPDSDETWVSAALRLCTKHGQNPGGQAAGVRIDHEPLERLARMPRLSRMPQAMAEALWEAVPK